MNDSQHDDQGADHALCTLEQLSETLKVMSTVVDRLKRELSEQLLVNARQAAEPAALEPTRTQAELIIEIPLYSAEDNDCLH